MKIFRRREIWFLLLPALFVLVGCGKSPTANLDGKRSGASNIASENRRGATLANNRTEDGRKIVRLPVASDEPLTLDPAVGSSLDSRCGSQIYESLLQYKYLKRPLQLEPCLLETMPEVSDDGTMYQFRLKPGVYFQDDPCFPRGKGRELIADDVLYSWKRLADPDVPTRNWRLLRDKIVGLDEFRDAFLEQRRLNPSVRFDYDSEIAGMQKTGDHEFQIQLRRPTAGFPWTLALFQTAVVPREAVEKYQSEFGSHPVGTGPYRLTQWTPQKNMIMDRNPNFRDEFYPSEHMPEDQAAGRTAADGKKLPMVDRIETVFYAQSQPMWLDFRSRKLGFTTVPAAFHDEAFGQPGKTLKPGLEKEGITCQPVPLLDFIYIGFNMEDSLLGGDSEKNRCLRQAIALAIDWDEINREFYNDSCTIYDGMIPPGIDGYPEQGVVENAYRGPDLKRAGELLAKAGYPGGNGLTEIGYDSAIAPPGPEMAEIAGIMFAAALLQDMAVPLLAKELPEDYNKLFSGRHGGRTRLSDLEMERFGWTHAEAAGIMARRWSLPETFADLIEIHASFEDLVLSGATAGQVAVSLSALLPSVQDSDWFEREQFVDAFRRLTNKETSDLTIMFVRNRRRFRRIRTRSETVDADQSLAANLEPEEAATS